MTGITPLSGSVKLINSTARERARYCAIHSPGREVLGTSAKCINRLPDRISIGSASRLSDPSEQRFHDRTLGLREQIAIGAKCRTRPLKKTIGLHLLLAQRPCVTISAR